MELELSDALRDYNESADFLGFQKSVSKFSNIEWQRPKGASLTDQRVGIISNFSTQFLAAALRPSLLSRGIWPEIFEDEYNQWELTPRNASAPLFGFKPDVVLFLLSSIPLAFGRDSSSESLGKRIVESVLAVKKTSGAKVILSLPEPLEEEKNRLTWAYEWRETLRSYLIENLSKEVLFFDLEPLIRKVGAGAWYSHRYYVLSKFPFHPQNTKLVSDSLADLISDSVSPRVKLVITDLDNTLWGGIVGEEGASNVDLNFEERGYGHLRLQKFLHYLHSRGVLLAVVSKNNEVDALEVFRTRAEMLLRLENFSSLRINWKPKSENIKEILNELKLSTAGVVFLDDTPFERAEVRSALPEIEVPELGRDPVLWVDQLLDKGIFYRNIQSEVDQNRAELYRTEKGREEEKAKFSDEASFLKSLQLKLTVKRYRGNEQRILDLLAKTNQFNLTTRRHSKTQLEDFLSKGAQIFAFDLEDRFGSYGIISVALLVPTHRGDARGYWIETFLMSCRVIGRKIENAILSFLIDENSEANFFRGEFRSSEKNKMVENLYSQFGFYSELSRDGESSQYFDLDVSKRDLNRFEHFCKIEKDY